jgi:thiol:disulfide interchange protein DsbD
LLVAVGLSSAALAKWPKSAGWTLWLKRLSGLVLLGMAEYYFVQMGKVL